MRRKPDKLAEAAVRAVQALTPPLTLPPAPETHRAIHDQVLRECRRLAAEIGMGDTAFLDSRIKTRLHRLLLAPDARTAHGLGQRLVAAVQIHLLASQYR